MIPEWVGATPLSRMPQFFKNRILRHYNKCCADCGRIFTPHLKVYFDGRENRESKLKPYCPVCHRQHAARDPRVRVGSVRVGTKFSEAYLNHPKEGKSNGSNKEVTD